MDEKAITENDITQSIYSHFRHFTSTTDKINFLEHYFQYKITLIQKIYILLCALFAKEHEKNITIFEKYANIYNKNIERG